MKRYILGIFAVLTLRGLLWSMTADELIQKTGLAGGLCVFPRATRQDLPLALELAKKPTFVVFLLSKDDASAANIRQSSGVAERLGRSLYVETGKAMALPFATRLADVLVIGDLRDTDLTPEARAEWLRVLAPQRGVALVGCAATTSSGLLKPSLDAWAKGAPQAQVVADGSGLWATLRTGLPAGSDAWTHRRHGPESSAVSSDTAFQAPFLAQWWGLPRQEGFFGTMVIAGHGRMFAIRSSIDAQIPTMLTARDLNNGIVLWQRDLSHRNADGKMPLTGGYVVDRSCAIALEDTLLLADGDGVLQLDAETGATRGRIAGPTPSGSVKSILVTGDLLVMLGGEKDVMASLRWHSTGGNPTGRDLTVYDMAKKKVLWHETVAGDIDERTIALRDRQLYFLVQGVGLSARELESGKTIWANTDTALWKEFTMPDPALPLWLPMAKTNIVGQHFFSLPVISALPDVLILRAPWAANTVALARKTGQLLWKKPLSYSGRGPVACAWSNLWLSDKQTLDLMTGNVVPTAPKLVTSGCGPSISTPNYLITAFGLIMNLNSSATHRLADIKTICDDGSIVSDGLMVSVPGECNCGYEVKGYRVLASAGTIQPHTAPPWQNRLTSLDSTDPAPLKITDVDWPTYRHDAQRSGCSPASVGKTSRILWHWKSAGGTAYASAYANKRRAKTPLDEMDLPSTYEIAGRNCRHQAFDANDYAPDFISTAPVAADGLVWFGAPDGSIRCVKADSGQEVWSFPTGGMLFRPPTLWQGRLLAGSGDGYIYCLEARTGKCLWRLQVAPTERRVFWFGHLISTWPVMSGVAVQDGIAYAVAGFQQWDGLHAYAINPKNGHVLWENDASCSKNNNVAGDNRAGNTGGLALSQDRMWLPTISFDRKTGESKDIPTASNFGSEVGIYDDFLLRCGARLTEPQHIGAPGTIMNMMDLHGTDPKYPGFNLDMGTTIPPVWNASQIVIAKNGNLKSIPVARLGPWIKAVPPKMGSSWGAPDWSVLKTWEAKAVQPMAVALTKDQVVATCLNGSAAYTLKGFHGADGATAWSVDLPEQPVGNSLAVDRDGHVLVSLCDGSIVCLGQ